MADVSTNLSSSSSSLEIQNAKKCEELYSNSSVVAVKLKDCIVIVARKPQNNPLELTQHRIVNRVSENILVTACGVGMDNHHLVQRARTESAMAKASTELPIQTEQLVSKLSDYLQRFVSSPEYRPFGVTAIVAGQNANKVMRLFKITADGEKFEYNACCIGRNASSYMAELEKMYDVNDSPEKVLRYCVELFNERRTKNVQVGLIKDGEEAKLLTDIDIELMLTIEK